jgi:hypothetical protein
MDGDVQNLDAFPSRWFAVRSTEPCMAHCAVWEQCAINGEGDMAFETFRSVESLMAKC